MIDNINDDINNELDEVISDLSYYNTEYATFLIEQLRTLQYIPLNELYLLINLVKEIINLYQRSADRFITPPVGNYVPTYSPTATELSIIVNTINQILKQITGLTADTNHNLRTYNVFGRLYFMNIYAYMNKERYGRDGFVTLIDSNNNVLDQDGIPMSESELELSLRNIDDPRFTGKKPFMLSSNIESKTKAVPTKFSLAGLFGKPAWFDSNKDYFAPSSSNLSYNNTLPDSFLYGFVQTGDERRIIEFLFIETPLRVSNLNQNTQLIPQGSIKQLSDVLQGQQKLKEFLWNVSVTFPWAMRLLDWNESFEIYLWMFFGKYNAYFNYGASPDYWLRNQNANLQKYAVKEILVTIYKNLTENALNEYVKDYIKSYIQKVLNVGLDSFEIMKSSIEKGAYGQTRLNGNRDQMLRSLDNIKQQWIKEVKDYTEIISCNWTTISQEDFEEVVRNPKAPILTSDDRQNNDRYRLKSNYYKY